MPSDRCTRRQCLLSLGGLLALPVMGNPRGATELHVWAQSPTSSQQALLQALASRVGALKVLSDPGDWSSHRPGASSPVLLMGPAALRQGLLSGLRGPVLAVVTSAQAQQVLQSQPQVREWPAGWTVLCTDTAMAAQVQLAVQLLERRGTLGVVLSDQSAHLERSLRLAAQDQNLNLQVERVNGIDGLVAVLPRLSSTQALLAVSDSTLYTPDSLRVVLESTYRRGQPVLGFSTATVTAGTLATAYSEVSDLAADIGEWVERQRDPGPGSLPAGEMRHARYWRVKINDSVARSLGMNPAERVYKLGTRPSGRYGG